MLWYILLCVGRRAWNSLSMMLMTLHYGINLEEFCQFYKLVSSILDSWILTKIFLNFLICGHEPNPLLASPRHNQIICICTPVPFHVLAEGKYRNRIKRTFSPVKMCAGWTFLNGPCSRPSSALRFGVINTSRAAADDSEAWLGGHGQSYQG